MWSSNDTKCLVRGHVSSTFNYKGVEYNYCVRCGKISLNHHTSSADNPDSSSRNNTGAKSGMISIMSMSK